jgi:hypothetical protein
MTFATGNVQVAIRKEAEQITLAGNPNPKNIC